jgi:hypothetical protein
MIKILAQPSQVFSIFGKSKFNLISQSNDEYTYKLIHDSKEYLLLIKDTSALEIKWNSEFLHKNLNYWEELSKNILFNPPEDFIILADRWIFDTTFIQPSLRYGVNFIYKLDNLYKSRNVKLIFANSYYEPLDYEDKHYVACSYDYQCNNIRFTDYPLFKNVKNIKFNRFYNLWNYIYDILAYDVSPNNKDKINNGEEVYYDWLENIVTPKTERKFKFGMLGGKPRYHRLYFINKIIENGLVDDSYVTMNKWFFNEYVNSIKENNYYTDTTLLIKPEVKKYWNLDFYKDESHYNKIYDPLGEDLRFEYTTQNIINQEYNESYLEIVGETHIIFDKLFDFWSEKTYHPLFFEKLFISVGANQFYREFEQLGGHTFIKELNLNPNFINEEDPIKQMDYVIECLSNHSKDDIKKIYLNNIDKIKHNKKLILDWVYDNTNFIREYIINSNK